MEKIKGIMIKLEDAEDVIKKAFNSPSTKKEKALRKEILKDLKEKEDEIREGETIENVEIEVERDYFEDDFAQVKYFCSVYLKGNDSLFILDITRCFLKALDKENIVNGDGCIIFY